MNTSHLGSLTNTGSRVPSALILAISAVFCSACDSVPTRSEASVARAATPDESALRLKEQAFFNLAPLSLPLATAGDSVPPTVLTRAMNPDTSEAHRQQQGFVARQPNPDLSVLPEAALLDELARRWSSKWSGASEVTDDADWTMLRDGLALGLLQPDHGSDQIFRSLAMLAASRSAPDDVRLLAAAYHAHHGAPEHAREVLAGLFEPEASEQQTTDLAVASTNDSFQITGLSFARSIEGPSKFTPATLEEILPGRKVLIYGEFRHFKNEPEGLKGVGTTYRRSFSATLRLLSSTGKELDRLAFLPRDRGLQRSQTESEVMNFWAKYQLPADLPPGTYKFVVEAEDILGDASATGELDLELAAPSRGGDS